jgi:DNA processing protein
MFKNINDIDENTDEKMNENSTIKNWSKKSWPQGLHEIPQPPKSMRMRGYDFSTDPVLKNFKRLCVVGSRKYSEYGEQVCRSIIEGLSGWPITIVSGLAFGIDSIAHRAALNAGLHTIAIPGSGLNDSVIYPRAHFNLSQEILNSGGCMLSEFSNDFRTQPYAFPQRNRLMVGISDAVLIIEAAEKSGSTITARMATDYNRDLMVVPGSILIPGNSGTNRLLKDGAFPVCCADDVLEILGFDPKPEISSETPGTTKTIKNKNIPHLSSVEKMIYGKIPTCDTIEKLTQKILSETGGSISVSEINESIASMEINDIIQFVDGKICQK